MYCIKLKFVAFSKQQQTIQEHPEQEVVKKQLP